MSTHVHGFTTPPHTTPPLGLTADEVVEVLADHCRKTGDLPTVAIGKVYPKLMVSYDAEQQFLHLGVLQLLARKLKMVPDAATAFSSSPVDEDDDAVGDDVVHIKVVSAERKVETVHITVYQKLEKTYYSANGTSKPLIRFTVQDIDYIAEKLSAQADGLNAKVNVLKNAESLLKKYHVETIGDLPDKEKQKLNDSWPV